MCRFVWMNKCLSFFLSLVSELQHALRPPKCCEPENMPQFLVLPLFSFQTHAWVYQGAWECVILKALWFSCGVHLLHGSGAKGRFSLFNVGFMPYKSIMLVCFLRWTMQFTIVFLILGIASNNSKKCILAPPRVYPSLPCKQPKNPKSVINLKTLLKHVHGLL